MHIFYQIKNYFIVFLLSFFITACGENDSSSARMINSLTEEKASTLGECLGALLTAARYSEPSSSEAKFSLSWNNELVRIGNKADACKSDMSCVAEKLNNTKEFAFYQGFFQAQKYIISTRNDSAEIGKAKIGLCGDLVY